MLGREMKTMAPIAPIAPGAIGGLVAAYRQMRQRYSVKRNA